MSGDRIAAPPPALGVLDHSPEGVEVTCAVARHLLSVVRHRTLSRAQQVQALLVVAANIAADVPADQREAALAFYMTDAALRWHMATRDAPPSLAEHLAQMAPMGSA